MKKLFVVLLCVFMVFLFTACAAQPVAEQPQNDDQQRPDRSDQLYIQVSALGHLDYFYDHKMGLRIAGEELGVRTEYVGPADLDMGAMITAFESAIAKRPNGIIVVGFDASLDPIVNKAIDQGIPVVTVDADLPTSRRLAFVGTGNKNAGRMGAEKLVELIGGRGKVAIMTRPGQSNLDERVAGYKEVLARYPDIEIVHVADTQGDPVIAAKAAATLLLMYPDLAGIACVEAAGGSGAATAVREAGRVGQVKIVAMDRGSEVLDAIEEGIISASVAQQTALMPFYALQILYNLNNSRVEITTDNKAAGVLGIPSVVDTGVIIIDINNFEYFRR